MKDPVLNTIDTYNRIASKYKERYTKQDSNNMKGFLDKFLAFLNENFTEFKVLDIGSGAGFDAKYLSENNCEVVGIDLSESFLDIAKEVAPKAKFYNMDLRNLSFENSDFNGIWASSSLSHTERKDFPKVINSFTKILKTKGVLFLTLKEGEGSQTSIEKDLENAERFFTYYNEQEIKDELSKNGFMILEISKNSNRQNTWINFFAKKI
jgi:ubiquinone/menaquinone biosynthesis C-methylase UbiE